MEGGKGSKGAFLSLRRRLRWRHHGFGLRQHGGEGLRGAAHQHRQPAAPAAHGRAKQRPERGARLHGLLREQHRLSGRQGHFEPFCHSIYTYSNNMNIL